MTYQVHLFVCNPKHFRYVGDFCGHTQYGTADTIPEAYTLARQCFTGINLPETTDLTGELVFPDQKFIVQIIVNDDL